MSKHRIYQPGMTRTTGQTELGKDDFHYVKNVLRLKPGDELLLFDGTRNECEAVIDRFDQQKVLLHIRRHRRIDDESPSIILAQALPKESKMDFIIQKATELGVSAVIPFISSRTVPRLTAEKAAARVGRWRKIAAEAAKQCGGVKVPVVSEILTFEAMLDQVRQSSLNILFWEEESKQGIRDVLPGTSRATPDSLSIVVGPEGGFSRDEAATALRSGFVTAHLGRRILRTETAALVILSIIQYEMGSIGASP